MTIFAGSCVEPATGVREAAGRQGVGQGVAAGRPCLPHLPRPHHGLHPDEAAVPSPPHPPRPTWCQVATSQGVAVDQISPRRKF
jgi:hypothetical protein